MPLDRRQMLALGTASLAAAWRGAPARASFAEDPLSVVATTGMIADAARVIAGPRAEVRALMGPGVDPHAYRQTRTDIVAVVRAGLTLWHGLYLEAQMEEFMANLDRKREVVAVAEAIPRERLIGHETYANRLDPHVWMDPELWSIAIGAVADALGAVRPAGGEAFATNAAGYRVSAAALSGYSQEVLATVPPDSRVLLTAHDAFRYFGRAYGFEVVGIQGISTESEAGLNRIGTLVDMLVRRGIGAVFVESSVSARNVRALIEGAASRGHAVRIGGELYSDAMGSAGTYEGTWIGMIDHNVTTIARALGGRVPERGMAGLLRAEA